MYDKNFWVMWKKWLLDIDKTEKEVAIKVGVLPNNLNRSNHDIPSVPFCTLCVLSDTRADLLLCKRAMERQGHKAYQKATIYMVSDILLYR